MVVGPVLLSLMLSFLHNALLGCHVFCLILMRSCSELILMVFVVMILSIWAVESW